ncbi:MAG: glucose-6-phosphate dehydrogenase [Acidobacteriota bacterium]
MENPGKFILVIFGASGDLTKRKLIPSMFSLYLQDLLPEDFAIVGLGRTPYTDEKFREKLRADLSEFSPDKISDRESLERFLGKLYYFPMNASVTGDYKLLKDRLAQLDKDAGANRNFIYYLSTSPDVYGPIAENLGAYDLQHQGGSEGWKRLVVEKPFGTDLESAKFLNRTINQVFAEEQVYRIDHYLGKETVQNILAFRFANGMFEPLWNSNYIHHVEITSAEFIGVENSGKYYDGSGALRDMVQNHLLQILAVVAMEPPSRFEDTAIRNEKVKLFQSIRPMLPQNISKEVVRGQYLESVISGNKVSGYRQEPGIDSESRTETYTALRFFIDSWRWGEVPFYIRTGKRMPARVTEVVIHFKKTPHYIFSRDYKSENKLVIRIQPDEGILMNFGMKLPGAGFQIKTVGMDFHYSDLGKVELADAYERLLLDCLIGDATLYARADAVEACWSFITPILDVWENDPEAKLFGYPAGTWGPEEGQNLFLNSKESWRCPCGNLIQEGDFCEL